ncbi:hypothetical protein YPPY89_1893, partial [Yersinia pestis PY-89]
MRITSASVAARTIPAGLRVGP